MGEHGFIRDMLDVKVLILYVMNQAEKPLTIQNIYELCYQDDRLTYFDVCEAVPQLVATGHIEEQEGGLYAITEKGRRDGAACESSLPYSVRRKSNLNLAKVNGVLRRNAQVRAQILPRDEGG